MLPLVVKGEALCCALSLVVAAALANAVDVAPVGFCLRVLQGIPIHLIDTCPQYSLRNLHQAEAHIVRDMQMSLCGLAFSQPA